MELAFGALAMAIAVNVVGLVRPGHGRWAGDYAVMHVRGDRGVRVKGKLNLVVVVWLSGFIAGALLFARWWRIGQRQLTTATSAPIAEEPASADKVQLAAQRLTGPIVAAAKSDLGRLRNATRSVSHRVPDVVGANNTADAS